MKSSKRRNVTRRLRQWSFRVGTSRNASPTGSGWSALILLAPWQRQSEARLNEKFGVRTI
jgi:hypothetical protein